MRSEILFWNKFFDDALFLEVINGMKCPHRRVDVSFRCN